jgi:SAM-dependent methyltransferase
MVYLILQNPGHNRVYYNLADKLARAELELACTRLENKASDVEIVLLSGIRYLSFKYDGKLSENDLGVISRLSFVFALFELEETADKKSLVPIKRADYAYVDEKIGTLLKYQGKTNELFTRMMLNVALLTSKFDYGDKIRLLDPVAGKGTTLYEGLIYGFDSYGIEIESKFVHEADVFFRKYLENEKLKHNAQKRKVAGKKKSDAVHMQEYEFARSKEEFKSGENLRKLGFICGNAMESSQYFHENYFHLIVGDLPYGIFHGSASQKKGTSRNPIELIQACLKDWKKVLKPGGVIVLAWNSFLLARDEMWDLFRVNGYEVMDEPPYDEFEHRVDKSIKRDIVIAYI